MALPAHPPSASPTRSTFPHLPPPIPASNPPFSPRLNRGLRRFQSAANLGAHRTPGPGHGHGLGLSPQKSKPDLRSQRAADSARAVPALPPPQRRRANSDLHAPSRQSSPKRQTGSTAGSILAAATTSGPPPPPPMATTTTASKRMVLHSEKHMPPDLAAALKRLNAIPSLEALRQAALRGSLARDSELLPVRIYAWMRFLDVAPYPTNEYVKLVHRGPCPLFAKIKNDTFRTLTTDPLFRRRVSEQSLIRVLNSVAWVLADMRAPAAVVAGSNGPSNGSDSAKTNGRNGNNNNNNNNNNGVDNYIQGMNVLCAPLLYASRSESQAFATFHCLITQHLPAYTRAGMSGVHLGLSLIDRLLHVLDPQLSVYLTGRGLSASLYAFPSVLTLGACTPPLLEVLALWDFLLAQGPWLNLLAVVAQVVSMREVLLKDPSPNRYLRSLPPLRADQTIALVTGFLERVPEGLLREVREHAR